MPFRFTAYDGSAAGARRLHGPAAPGDRSAGCRTSSPLPATSGMARAYVAGDLVVDGVHPATRTTPDALVMSGSRFRRPTPAEALASLLRTVGLRHLVPPPAPAAGGAAAVASLVEGVAAQQDAATPRRSSTTTTSPTASTSWCSARR